MTSSPALSGRRDFHLRVFCAMLLVACWLLVFWQPIGSAARVWWSNDTYLHCFFIIPAVFYMIWSKRADWLQLEPTPCYLALIPIVVVLLVALTGVVVDVQLFQHVGMFAVIPLAVLLLLGWPVARHMGFPLLFIMFSVPVGEELSPALQDITADMAVVLIELSGVSVFRNGLFIDIAAGRFIVAEACSGVRYFIAALVFAALYGYISFDDLRRRIIYIFVAAIIAIVANGIRVYATIMVAHFFGMEYADGFDHLVYGWVFFAIVIVMLMFVGETLRPKQAKDNELLADYKVNRGWQELPNSKSTILLIIVILAYGATAHYYATPQEVEGLKPDIAKLGVTTEPQSWNPVYTGGEQILVNLPPTKGSQPQLFVAYYETINSNGELVSQQNRLFDIERWSVKQSGVEQISVDNDQSVFDVDRLLITSGAGHQQFIISWYETGQGRARSGTKTKLLQAFDRLKGGKGGGARIVLSIPVLLGQQGTAKEKLLENAKEYGETIQQALPL